MSKHQYQLNIFQVKNKIVNQGIVYISATYTLGWTDIAENVRIRMQGSYKRTHA